MIFRRFRVFLFLSAAVFFLNAVADAQSDNVRITVANMKQDLAAMVQHVKALRLEVEQLQRDNQRLQQAVEAAQSNRRVEVQVSALKASVEQLRADYAAADQAQKAVILKQVTEQINVLTREMESALEAVAKAVGSQPSAPKRVEFSEDYPKTGFSYVVKPGDSLSRIARNEGSKVKWIQDANQIVNPSRDLKVGQTIFIPISQ